MLLRMMRLRAAKYYRVLKTTARRLSIFLKRIPCTELHCIGDSHIEVFEFIEDNDPLSHTVISTTKVGGATAQGAVNPNSQTNALQIFMKSLKGLSRSSHVLFMLGEVDCGFVIWYRAGKHQVPIEEQLERSLQNYFELLSSVEAMGFRHIYVCTSHPPTIRDGQDFGEVANLRREVKATQRERTDLTFEYNNRLRTRSAERGYILIDIEPDIIDPHTNLVSDRFLNQDPTNHHLEMSQVAPLYKRALQKAGL